MKKILTSLFLITIIFSSCNTTQQQKAPKYIFLFIGDGMGAAQVQLSDMFARATTNDSIAFLHFPHVGLQDTYSLSSKITCSAAAGTALATGHKTKANFIGVNADGQALKSIAYTLQDKGYKIGILTSVSIDHATPSVFYAHDTSRNNYHAIGMQLPQSGFDFFGGGMFIEPIKGDNNIFNELAKHNYTLVTSPDSANIVPQLNSKVCMLSKETDFAYSIDTKEGQLTLPLITQTAIEYLQSPNGFFMMVEGGKIDWSCHSNDATTTIKETLEFSEAVNKAIQWYNQHPDETLIVVTADHETGGLAIGSALYPYYTDIALLKNQKYSYVENEIQLTQLIDSSANNFTFEACMKFLTQAYNIGASGVQLSAYDSLRLRDSYLFAVQQKPIPNQHALLFYNIDQSALYTSGNKASAIITTMNKIIAEKAGIGWTTFAHSGIRVPVYAIGNGSEQFGGVYDNTDIPKKILSLFEK